MHWKHFSLPEGHQQGTWVCLQYLMGTGAKKHGINLLSGKVTFKKFMSQHKIKFHVSALCSTQSLSIQGPVTTLLTVQRAHPFRGIG